MKRLITISMLFIAFFCGGCRSKSTYSGYVEGDFIQVSPEVSGILQNLAVAEGDTVKKDQLLFILNANDELYAKEQAQAIVNLKQSTLNNLVKGKRRDELDVLIAQREQVKVILELSTLRLNRHKNLLSSGAITQDQFDETQTTYENNKAQLIVIDAEIHLANLGAREDEIQAARADLENAVASLKKALWQVSKKTIYAPAEAYVQDTLYRIGELVTVGTPVVILLPNTNLKARFFVSERHLSRIKRGQSVKLFCDSCKGSIIATINYISTEAEYTPPVIFSKSSREKLVFLVEAKISPQYINILHPGQPLDVVVEHL